MDQKAQARGWRLKGSGCRPHAILGQPPQGYLGASSLPSLGRAQQGLHWSGSPQGPRCYKEVKGLLQTTSHPRQWKKQCCEGLIPVRLATTVG